jgi:hypothetical protein
MNSKVLVKRLERLEDRMLLGSGEPLVIEVRGSIRTGRLSVLCGSRAKPSFSWSCARAENDYQYATTMPLSAG